MQNKVLKLQVRIELENEVKIKHRVENGGHLPKFDGRRAQEHLVKIVRRRKIWSSLSLKALVKWENWPRLWLLKTTFIVSEMLGLMGLQGLIVIFLI